MPSRQPDQNALGSGYRSAGATPKLQTQQINPMARFSYAETPEQLQHSVFEPPSPTNSTIDESPVFPEPYRHRQAQQPESVTISTYAEKGLSSPVNSPYNFPSPQAVHPAHSAPYVAAPSSYRPATSPPPSAAPKPHQRTANIPTYPLPSKQIQDSTEDRKQLPPQSTTPIPSQTKMEPPMTSSTTQQMHDSAKDRKQATPLQSRALTYNPDSPSGPNPVPVESHRPGQISHPNAQLEPEWKHGMCELDALCCTALFCPCMVYGRTQYRLSQKAQKREATDLLAYESVNGSCGLMAISCGFQCW